MCVPPPALARLPCSPTMPACPCSPTLPACPRPCPCLPAVADCPCLCSPALALTPLPLHTCCVIAIPAIVKQSTDGRGVDMVLDIVGGPYAQRNLDALAEDGTLAIIGLLGGHKAEISLNRIMLKRLHVTGSTLRGQGAALKTRLRQAIAERVLPLVEARRVVPHVHRVFPLEDVADAQKLMEVGGHMGKIVLQVAEPA